MNDKNTAFQSLLILLQIFGYTVSLWMYGLNQHNLIAGMSSDFLAGFFLAISISISVMIISRHNTLHESY